MTNGLSSPDSAIGIRPPEIKAPEFKKSTPLPPEFNFIKPVERQSTMEELPKPEEPANKADVEKLMAEILRQDVKPAPEIKKQILNKAVTKNKPEGFIAKIIDWLRTTFRNLFK